MEFRHGTGRVREGRGADVRICVDCSTPLPPLELRPHGRDLRLRCEPCRRRVHNKAARLSIAAARARDIEAARKKDRERTRRRRADLRAKKPKERPFDQLLLPMEPVLAIIKGRGEDVYDLPSSLQRTYFRFRNQDAMPLWWVDKILTERYQRPDIVDRLLEDVGA